MIGDGVPETTLERWTSDDFNNAQELGMRMTMELARANARHYQTTAGAAPTAPLRTHLASGLTVQQNAGTTITVGIGVLAQQIAASPPTVPATAALDSSYRVGLNLGVLDATDPSDGFGSFWLLEGQVQRVTTLSEIRDIYNPAAVPPVFAPSPGVIAKRYEARVVVRWVKDPVNFATQLPANTAGWAPLGACWRPAIGGVITDADVFNLSVQIDDIAQHTTDEGRAIRNDFRCYGNAGIGVNQTGFVHTFDAVCQGLHVFAHTEDGVASDFRDATMAEAASVAALAVAQTWGYIYLAPLADRMPSGLHPNIHHRGALIVSRTPPDYYGRNSAPITAPAPLAENIAGGGAVHIGILQSNGAVNWNYVDVTSGGEGRVTVRQFNLHNFPMNQGNNYGAGALNLATAGAGGTEDVPFGVNLKCFCTPTNLATGLTADAIEVIFALPGDSATYTDYTRILLSFYSLSTEFFELYPRAAFGNMTVTTTARDFAMAPVAIAAGSVGANAHVAGICGFRF